VTEGINSVKPGVVFIAAGIAGDESDVVYEASKIVLCRFVGIDGGAEMQNYRKQKIFR
jgi:NADPH-dependent curcumin reductase CurA